MEQRQEEMARYETDKLDFARRLNLGLDEAGIPQRGRPARLQELLSKSPSTTDVQVPSLTAIRKWLEGDSLPEVKRLGTISNIIGKSVQWLLTGSDANVDEAGLALGDVPLLSWVQAGAFCDNGDIPLPEQVEEFIPSPVKVGKRAYAVRVRGDSMISINGGRSYPEGTILIVDPDATPEHNKRVIARIGDETTFKELVNDAGNWFLRPLNPQYRMIEVTEDVVICGVVRCAVQQE
ncbi:LexA family protein [Aeromonas veronii]|uniref:LexA family protein n=1 Tax=Aeromonas jandaei TaxID=650 RepID=UPI0038B4DC5D